MRYKCIIFDCDGVLVDSEEISNRVHIEMVKEIGLDIEMEYAMEKFSGKSLNSIFEYFEERIGKKLPNNFESEFRRRTFELFKTDIQAIPGIHDLLDKISIPICVASSGPLEKIKLNLTSTNLIEKFNNNIFSSYEIGSWKPDPGIFEHAAKSMGFEPKDCVVIEDSISGINAAKRGGFEVFGFTNGINKGTFKNEGIKVFHHMEALITLLK